MPAVNCKIFKVCVGSSSWIVDNNSFIRGNGMFTSVDCCIISWTQISINMNIIIDIDYLFSFPSIKRFNARRLSAAFPIGTKL